jgi:hypothetical protein
MADAALAADLLRFRPATPMPAYRVCVPLLVELLVHDDDGPLAAYERGVVFVEDQTARLRALAGSDRLDAGAGDEARAYVQADAARVEEVTLGGGAAPL